MSILTHEEALQKREQLVRDGFCVIPGVLHGEFLHELQDWSDALLASTPVDPKYKYQGSDIHVATERRAAKGHLHARQIADPMIDRLVDWPLAWEACALLGLERQTSDESAILLSKPAGGPPLYWHQDWMNWNSPLSMTPWPTRIFLSYYMVDTSRENGCLRAIPGSHLKRLPLHDLLPDAHEAQIQASDTTHPAFSDYPDAVDLPVNAGDLVINDARALHAAYANTSRARRTLILQWHDVFGFEPPSWWDAPIPDEVRHADRSASYKGTRTPGKYLRPAPHEAVTA